MWKSELRQNYYRTSFSPTVSPFAARISRIVVDGGTRRPKWERLKAGESNGKLPPRTYPGCSVPEPYQSHDWALVPAKPGLQGWIVMNERILGLKFFYTLPFQKCSKFFYTLPFQKCSIAFCLSLLVSKFLSRILQTHLLSKCSAHKNLVTIYIYVKT